MTNSSTPHSHWRCWLYHVLYTMSMLRHMTFFWLTIRNETKLNWSWFTYTLSIALDKRYTDCSMPPMRVSSRPWISPGSAIIVIPDPGFLCKSVNWQWPWRSSAYGFELPDIVNTWRVFFWKWLHPSESVGWNYLSVSTFMVQLFMFENG